MGLEISRGDGDRQARQARSVRATMRDAAKRASISVTTASDVINERADSVGASTQRRVERAGARLCGGGSSAPIRIAADW
jgi:hypothetical protein